jgi:hypothetical protein
MTRNTPRAMLDPQTDLRTDYVLIAVGVGASVIALIYLLLI